MRKTLAFVAGISLAVSAGVTAPGAALAKGASEEAHACQNVSGQTVGECVSSQRGNIPKVCKLDIGGTPLWQLLGFRNSGGCVSYIRSLQD